MKHVQYAHAAVKPIVAEIHRLLMVFLDSRLRPHLSRLFPSRKGRRIIARSMWCLGLLMQVLLLWLLGELISLCIDVMNLWALLAAHHYAITA
jgi:hypothetical protein